MYGLGFGATVTERSAAAFAWEEYSTRISTASAGSAPGSDESAV
jgi:hypothetical protein